MADSPKNIQVESATAIEEIENENISASSTEVYTTALNSILSNRSSGDIRDHVEEFKTRKLRTCLNCDDSICKAFAQLSLNDTLSEGISNIEDLEVSTSESSPYWYDVSDGEIEDLFLSCDDIEDGSDKENSITWVTMADALEEIICKNYSINDKEEPAFGIPTLKADILVMTCLANNNYITDKKKQIDKLRKGKLIDFYQDNTFSFHVIHSQMKQSVLMIATHLYLCNGRLEVLEKSMKRPTLKAAIKQELESFTARDIVSSICRVQLNVLELLDSAIKSLTINKSHKLSHAAKQVLNESNPLKMYDGYCHEIQLKLIHTHKFPELY